MQLTCNYRITKVDTDINVMTVTYSLPGNPDITINCNLPDNSTDLNLYLSQRIPYSAWLKKINTVKEPTKIVENTTGKLVFDDSLLIPPSEEDISRRRNELESLRLAEVEDLVSKVLLQRENTTL